MCAELSKCVASALSVLKWIVLHMRGRLGAVVPDLPYEKVECRSVRWSWFCLSGVLLVMISAAPPLVRGTV